MIQDSWCVWGHGPWQKIWPCKWQPRQWSSAIKDDESFWVTTLEDSDRTQQFILQPAGNMTHYSWPITNGRYLAGISPFKGLQQGGVKQLWEDGSWKKCWRWKLSHRILAYLPSFTVKNQLYKCGQIYQSHGSYGYEDCFSWMFVVYLDAKWYLLFLQIWVRCKNGSHRCVYIYNIFDYIRI